MEFVNVHNITEKVQEVMARVPDPRLRQISGSLIAHLHAFIREVQPSQREFEQACEFLVALGQSSGPAKNEVILLSDILGASSLINLLNDQADGANAHHTDAALLGPFWRAHSPPLALGDSLARGQEALLPDQSLEVRGCVRNAAGQALATMDGGNIKRQRLAKSESRQGLRGGLALLHFARRNIDPRAVRQESMGNHAPDTTGAARYQSGTAF